MRSLIFLFLATTIYGKEPISFERFVENYFLLSKSKMENSPLAWQDTREGYFRAYGAFKADQVIDSLNLQAISHYEASIRHFKVMEGIRTEVYSGKIYDYLVNRSSRPNYNLNYFSSLKD